MSVSLTQYLPVTHMFTDVRMLFYYAEALPWIGNLIIEFSYFLVSVWSITSLLQHLQRMIKSPVISDLLVITTAVVAFLSSLFPQSNKVLPQAGHFILGR